MARQTRPFIGINADFVSAGKQTSPHVRLHAGYVDAVVTAGGLPVVLPPLGKDVDLDPLLDRLDGVILSGGLDLDPRRVGLPTHPAVQPLPERRDEGDRLLLRPLLERRPTLTDLSQVERLLDLGRRAGSGFAAEHHAGAGRVRPGTYVFSEAEAREVPASEAPAELSAQPAAGA